MEAKESQNRQSEIDYAYAVVDAIAEAMDRVAAKPGLAYQFMGDLLKEMPNLIDAIMVMTVPEHRKQMGQLVTASSRMCASCLKAAMK